MHVSTLVWILQHGQVNLWIVSHGQAYLTVNIITIKFSDSTGITCKTRKHSKVKLLIRVDSRQHNYYQ